MKKKVFKIYLFRHGRTVYNVNGLFCGHKHTRLVLRGKRDAKKISKKLRDKKIQVAFHTSLPRSKQTLNYVLKFHSECKKIIIDDRMIERSYGDLEGTTHRQFIEKIGKRSYDLRIEGDAIENLEPKFRNKVEKFFGEEEYEAIHRGYDVAAPNGESFADVEKRVKKFIVYLKNFMKKHKVNVAISAHGNSIRLFRKIMENVSREDAIKWFIPYDKVFEYDLKI
ncbi:histidine phosphatase family protein [Candidatus Pacearchaeota archaeon]|nr:histidine phosphatase family protein [Candidatus Pacearchaeota archaeon]